MIHRCILISAVVLLPTLALQAPPATAEAKPKVLLFGDTHLHSNNSFDAYLNRNMSADPDTAYRYAKGLPVIHPYHRARVQIETPLDFLVVADHAEYMGVMRTIIEDGIPREELGLVDGVKAFLLEYWLEGVIEDDEGMSAFTSFLPKPEPPEEAAKKPPAQAIPAAAAPTTIISMPALIHDMSVKKARVAPTRKSATIVMTDATVNVWKTTGRR